MIEAQALTKRYGDKTAVDGLSFSVRPGQVTGFLGPNGAGKSTTMRMIIGLDRPTAGRVTVGGRLYREHPAPLRDVGALLEAKSVHKGRTARVHLLGLAQTQGIPSSRVDEVLARVGLEQVAGRRAGGFSLGMSQRLGIAAALLGDPATVVLDEPVNGLDPDGVLWRYTPTGVDLEVTDDGAYGPIRPAGTAPENAHGLTGMVERAASYGGRVEAGPLPGSGWRVHTRLRFDERVVDR